MDLLGNVTTTESNLLKGSSKFKKPPKSSRVGRKRPTRDYIRNISQANEIDHINPRLNDLQVLSNKKGYSEDQKEKLLKKRISYLDNLAQRQAFKAEQGGTIDDKVK